MNESGWRNKHEYIMKDLLLYINERTSNAVLKGGTALMFGYGLDRFSEDIDIDTSDYNILEYISDYAYVHGYNINIKKDTETVKRAMLNYGETRLLKIECSFRLSESLYRYDINIVDGIRIHTLNTLMYQKLTAYSNRDKLRDLYDVVFIGLKYINELDFNLIDKMKDTLYYKGIEQFDYLISNQYDELVDEMKLGEDFLKLWSILRLG